MGKPASVIFLALILSSVSAIVTFRVPLEIVNGILYDASSYIDLDLLNLISSEFELTYFNPDRPDVILSEFEFNALTTGSKADVWSYSSDNQLTIWFFGNEMEFDFQWQLVGNEEVTGWATVETKFSALGRYSLGSTETGVFTLTLEDFSGFHGVTHVSVHYDNETDSSDRVLDYFEEEKSMLATFITSVFSGFHYSLLSAAFEGISDAIWPIEDTNFAIDYSLVVPPYFEETGAIVLETRGEFYDITAVVEELPQAEEAPQAGAIPEEEVAGETTTASEGSTPVRLAKKQDAEESAPPAARVTATISSESFDSWKNVRKNIPVTYALFPYNLPEGQTHLLNTTYLDGVFPGLLAAVGEAELYFECGASRSTWSDEPACELLLPGEGPVVSLVLSLSAMPLNSLKDWTVYSIKLFSSSVESVTVQYHYAAEEEVEFDTVISYLNELLEVEHWGYCATKRMGNAFELPKWDFLELKNENYEIDLFDFIASVEVSLAIEEDN